MATATNTIFVPGQTVPVGLLRTLTLTGAAGDTFIVMLLDVAGEPLTQLSDEVMVQDTTSPLLSVDDDQLLPVPTPTPLILH